MITTNQTIAPTSRGDARAGSEGTGRGGDGGRGAREHQGKDGCS